MTQVRGQSLVLVSEFVFSHRQRREDGVAGVVQLVVGDGGVQVGGFLHRLRRETKLTLLIQSRRQVAPTATEQTHDNK